MEFDLKILRGRDIPENLREIPQPPGKLYIAGSLPPQDTVCLAVVGSRKATTYGIDALSHEAALDAGLCAVAFPGSGISEKAFFPPTSLGLAHRIIKAGGCLLSEFEPDFKAQYYSFPMRNRLVAGISKAALIVEAGEKSGTLITARMALDYNKEVLAVPGPINSLNSLGTNRLLRQGATPITSSDDILEALGFKIDNVAKQETLFNDATPEEKLVLAILTEPISRDDLLRAMKMNIAEANSLLSTMEIKGLI